MHAFRNALLCALLFASPLALAQSADAASEPAAAIVSIYQIAPGKQLEFLQWMARQERVRTSVGLPATQWYAHIDGDAWDYVAVATEPTPEQDRAIDAAMQRAGQPTGFKAGLKVREFFAHHTDTIAAGPMGIDALVEAAK